MNIWVLDLDGVLQQPEYAHPNLFRDLSATIGVSFNQLFEHYTKEFVGNESEEDYHLSLCTTEEQRAAVSTIWQKLRQNLPKVTIMPGARQLLEQIENRGESIFAWTKGVGTEGIQRTRLESIGLGSFFPEGTIVSSPRKGKSRAIVKDLIPKLPQGRKVLVGDSYEQDVAPALRLGDFTCVWVRWDQEPPEGAGLDDPNLIIVESTQDLATKVKEGLLDVRNDH